MTDTTMRYFQKEDILQISIKDDPEPNIVELSPNITVELDENNDIVGVEILHASSYIRDNVLDTVQAKLLQQASSRAN